MQSGKQVAAVLRRREEQPIPGEEPAEVPTCLYHYVMVCFPDSGGRTVPDY